MGKLDFNQGTINFWIPSGKLNYGNNKFIMLFNYEDENGIIQIQKDKDNGLKVYYKYNNNGKCSLNTDVNNLDENKRHMITVTWSLPDKKVKLYINAILKSECDINTLPF